MKIIMYLFLVCLVLTISYSLVGCGLIGTQNMTSDFEPNLQEQLPEWLTIAHRVQAAEEPIIEPEKDDRSQETETVPAVNQPASTQTGSTQPAQQAQQPTQTGTPRWQQPGTMEYIAKLQLDQVAFHYKRLNAEIVELEAEKDKDEVKVEDLKAKIKERAERYKAISEVAVGIGLSLEKEYGITPPPVEKSSTDDSTWFYNWDESPSGFEKSVTAPR